MGRHGVSRGVRPRTVVIGMVAIATIVAAAVGLSLWLRQQHPGAVKLQGPHGDSPVSYAGIFPAEDDEPLANPLGIAYDGEYLYVAESDAGVIRIFDENGGRVGTIGLTVAEGQRVVYPSVIAIAGDRLAVVDNAGARALVISPEPADAATIHALLGHEDVPLLQPTAVTYSEGELLVADAGDKTIKTYDTEGIHLRTLEPASISGESALTALSVVDGVIYALGSPSGSVHALDLETGSPVRGASGEYPMPRTLEPVGGEMLAVVDGLNRSVTLIGADGTERAVIDEEMVAGAALSGPRGGAWVTDDERLYVTDASSGRVFVYNVRLELL